MFRRDALLDAAGMRARYEAAVGRLFAALGRPAPDLPPATLEGREWDGVCARNDYDAATRFLEIFAGDEALAPYAARLVVWRTRLIGLCPAQVRQVDGLIEEIRLAAAAEPAMRDAAEYIVGAAHLYAGRGDEAATIFGEVAGSSNGRLREAASYSRGRALLVAAQAAWDGYSDFARIDGAKLEGARAAFAAYVAAHPDGRYVASAEGLTRRIRLSRAKRRRAEPADRRAVRPPALGRRFRGARKDGVHRDHGLPGSERVHDRQLPVRRADPRRHVATARSRARAGSGGRARATRPRERALRPVSRPLRARRRAAACGSGTPRGVHAGRSGERPAGGPPRRSLRAGGGARGEGASRRGARRPPVRGARDSRPQAQPRVRRGHPAAPPGRRRLLRRARRRLSVHGRRRRAGCLRAHPLRGHAASDRRFRERARAPRRPRAS